MKFFHLSDLHIGKRFFEMPIVDDMRQVFGQILDAVDREKPDAVIIAGDVYDSTMPSVDAFVLFDGFITDLSKKGVMTYIISGNHDSPEKLGFGSKLFEKNNIRIAGIFSGEAEKCIFDNGREKVAIHLLPFVKPAVVRRMYPGEKIESYNDAVAFVIGKAKLEEGMKNILVAHQFVTSGAAAPTVSESETAFAGGVENVDASLFDGFDYVALGHIHSPQSIGRDTIRYCGSPMKFSFSERERDKSITVVDVNDDIGISTIPLKPVRDLRLIKGPIDDLIAAGKDDPGKDDFIYAQLTDINPIDPLSRLRAVYPNTVKLDIMTRDYGVDRFLSGDAGGERMDAFEIFEKLYKRQTGDELNDNQKKLVKDAMDEQEVVL